MSDQADTTRKPVPARALQRRVDLVESEVCSIITGLETVKSLGGGEESDHQPGRAHK